MAKVSLFLDCRYGQGDTFPLKLTISHRSTTAFYNLGIHLKVSEWQKPTIDCDGFVKKSNPNSKRLNSHIQSIVSKFEEQIRILEERRQLYSFVKAKDLKNYIADIIEGRGSTTFLVFLKDVISNIENGGTKRVFIETYKLICEFTASKDFLFEQVTPLWLERFEKHIGGSINYRSIHLRNIRTTYNKAIKFGIANYEHYPFRKFKIKKEQTAKRSLTVEQLADIKDMQLQSYQERYRDFFLLSFYLIGINMTDLLSLKHSDISDGRLIYKRAKTGKIYSIKLENEALELISKYKGKKYLLNFLDTSSYSSLTTVINKNLKQLGPTTFIGKHGKKEIHSDYTFLSTYWARHTWATIAAQLDIPKETIAAALGHEMGNSTTAIYINFDQKKVDVANRQVIDFLFSKKEK